MQEIHMMGGGRFFAGGGGDRRTRPHHQNHQALKCPRCESLDTKFCYYNNYNFSQPRHFCKSCRRYWTKGGVLRNVTVGGGCRKSKRPKNKTSENTSVTDTPALSPSATMRELKSKSHSSSESSSLTAANASSSATTTEAISANQTTNHLLTVHESKFFVNSLSGFPNVEADLLEQGAGSGIFSETGCFTSLMNSDNEALPFEFANMADTSPFRFHQQGSDQQPNHQYHHHHNLILKLPEITVDHRSILDQTLQFDFSVLKNKPANADVDFGPLDWPGVGDEGVFDLPTNPVDQTHWSQSHWTEHDPSSLHFP